MKVLDPGKPVRVSVPTKGSKNHADVQRRHSDAHDRSEGPQNRSAVVCQDFQIPRMPRKGVVLGSWKAVAEGARVYWTGMNANVMVPFTDMSPKFVFHFGRGRFRRFEPHVHRVPRDSVELIQCHVPSLHDAFFAFFNVVLFLFVLVLWIWVTRTVLSFRPILLDVVE